MIAGDQPQAKSEHRSIIAWLIAGFVLGFASLGVLLQGGFAGAAPSPDPTQWDPDVHPPLYIVHEARSVTDAGSIVDVQVHVACDFAALRTSECSPDVTLWASWGGSPYVEVPLAETRVDSLQVWTAHLPARHPQLGSLRYYFEASHRALGEPVRSPISGVYEPAVFDSFVAVPLDAPTFVEPEIVLEAPWGTGPTEIGLEDGSEQATVGPDAFAYAEDGTLALLDQVNGRVVTVSPEGVWTTFDAPLKGVGDVAFSGSSILVLDLVGETQGLSRVRIPQILKYDREGSLLAKAPVFAMEPRRLLASGAVVDESSNSLVYPFDGTAARSRSEQRATRKPHSFRVQVVSDQVAWLADLGTDTAFEVDATTGELGAIPEFTRLGDSYLVVFDQPNTFRIVWFDSNGTVERDVTVANERHSVFLPKGRVAVTSRGDVLILNSDEDGISIMRVPGPRGGKS
ncbi:MAG: hypothetical protein KatS3mg011_0711 [Acidimicrobiia bacterium]|nr:MAG: hypothetical protein KatS3mg011_0711 [Acidimicrobiia bacterium]